MDIKKLRKRAMYNPQSLTKSEWDIICENAFSVPHNAEDVKRKQKQIGEK